MWIFFEPARLYLNRTTVPEKLRVAGFCDNWGPVRDTDIEDWAVDIDLSDFEESELVSLFDDVPFALSFQQLKEIKTKQYEQKFDIICAARLFQRCHQEAIFEEQSVFIGAR